MESLNLTAGNIRYKAMIGVGGIGSGTFFKIHGNHTLGREESRSGYFLDQKDYCKLHIISHYMKTLLGTDFRVLPIGRLGSDDTGKKLMREMEITGFDLRYVDVLPGIQTLFSFCFSYPDGSGGNLTTSDSACSKVTPEYVLKAEESFEAFKGEGIALAVPEVSLEARLQLLKLAAKYHFFKVASFSSEEMKEVLYDDSLSMVDLLAINLDEASALAGLHAPDHLPSNIIEKVIKVCSKVNSSMILSITCGKSGSWSWDGTSLNHFPSIHVNVINTAGAGDAYLSGLLTGLTAGFSLKESHQIASLTGSFSVTSPHTIHEGLHKNSLTEFTKKSKIVLTEQLKQRMEVS
ncbi:hypothetical protein BH23BAC3_BH23BAC3_02890 [soil metagenome]